MGSKDQIAPGTEMVLVAREVDSLERRTEEVVREIERRMRSSIERIKRVVGTPKRIRAGLLRHPVAAIALGFGLLGLGFLLGFRGPRSHREYRDGRHW